jgi:hypothetical protein
MMAEARQSVALASPNRNLLAMKKLLLTEWRWIEAERKSPPPIHAGLAVPDIPCGPFILVG